MSIGRYSIKGGGYFSIINKGGGIMTAAEKLEEVNTAITKVLGGGQSYKMGSRSLTRADLGVLREMRRELQAEAAVEAESNLLGSTSVAYFEGR